jgi:hypothetical protein
MMEDLMRRTVLTVALGAAVIAMTAGQALAEFGAFAYDAATGKYGVSWNETDQKKADAAALKGCAIDGCKVVFQTGPRQCGAIAMTEDGKIWGGARRETRDGAKLAALENCQKRTKTQCVIRGNECNR